MRKNGRIVNVSSQSGQLKYFGPHLQTRFMKPDLSLTELDSLVSEYSVRYLVPRPLCPPLTTSL